MGNRRLLALSKARPHTTRVRAGNSPVRRDARQEALHPAGRRAIGPLLDLAHFKDFNDRPGHPAGDDALRAFAAILGSCMRGDDIAARYGGEEFAVLLPGVDTATAVAVAERIRTRTETMAVPLGAGISERITVSIGVAAAPEHATERAALLRIADAALYQAKAAGRNQVATPGIADAKANLAVVARAGNTRGGQRSLWRCQRVYNNAITGTVPDPTKTRLTLRRQDRAHPRFQQGRAYRIHAVDPVVRCARRLTESRAARGGSMAYRPPTDGFHPCLRCGADVADGAQFCPVCGAAQNVAPSVVSRRQGTPWWVPAGIIAGAIAALGAGVLLAALLDGGPDPVAGDPSPTATSSTAVSASTGPSGSAAPTASVEPTPEPAPIIPNLGIAAVVTDALNLRSQPNETASVVAELAPDQRLFVIGAPTEGADDLLWYRVAALAGPSCPAPCEVIGYVATPIEAGDPWIEEVGVNCPPHQ